MCEQAHDPRVVCMCCHIEWRRGAAWGTGMGVGPKKLSASVLSCPSGLTVSRAHDTQARGELLALDVHTNARVRFDPERLTTTRAVRELVWACVSSPPHPGAPTTFSLSRQRIPPLPGRAAQAQASGPSACAGMPSRKRGQPRDRSSLRSKRQRCLPTCPVPVSGAPSGHGQAGGRGKRKAPRHRYHAQHQHAGLNGGPRRLSRHPRLLRLQNQTVRQGARGR
jgi:hypothetical protein